MNNPNQPCPSCETYKKAIQTLEARDANMLGVRNDLQARIKLLEDAIGRRCEGGGWRSYLEREREIQMMEEQFRGALLGSITAVARHSLEYDPRQVAREVEEILDKCRFEREQALPTPPVPRRPNDAAN